MAVHSQAHGSVASWFAYPTGMIRVPYLEAKHAFMAPLLLGGIGMRTQIAFPLLAAMTPIALGVAGCVSSGATIPPGAHVETLQTRSLVLRGTAPAHPGSASCASPAAAPEHAHLLELKDDTTGDIVLRPTGGAAVMHVALLGSSKTWCVTTKGEGT